MNCNLQDHLCSLQMLVRKGMWWGLHFPLSDFSLIVELEGVGVEGQDFGFLFVLPPSLGVGQRKSPNSEEE